MKHGRFLSPIVVFCFSIISLLSFTDTAFGGDTSLRGLDGVMISVDIDELLIKEGLSKRQIIFDIELTLQQAGIKVLTDRQWRKTESHPRLFVQITGNKVQENWPFFTFAVNLQLQQDVYISRNGQTELHQAATWFNMKSGHGYRPDIQLQVKEMVGTFANDFTTANQM